MIKKLRRRFILVMLISIALVLGVMMSAINIANYHSVNVRADEKISVIAENGGTFPKKDGEKGDKPVDDIKPDRKMSAEAPFDTRYFTVKIDDDNTVVSVNTGMIAAVSTEKAVNYTKDLANRNKTSGFIDNYKYTCVNTDSGKMYIYLDCERELSTFYNFLIVSVLASVGGIILVYLLVLAFSKIVFKPVAESYEKQKCFITDASHEIKTPLTIIDASTEIIEMENGENEWTESIKNQVKRLTALTEKLVFLSRMDEESTKLTMLDFSISDAVLEVAKGFEPVAASQGKSLEIDIESNLSYCGDEPTIRQLVSLLLDNAMKYSNDNGSISISLKSSGKSRIILVTNSVEKIEKGRHDELFERFYRADSSRNSETGGHGIGLSVVKAIANAHKGKAACFSNDENSITFKIIL